MVSLVWRDVVIFVSCWRKRAKIAKSLSQISIKSNSKNDAKKVILNSCIGFLFVATRCVCDLEHCGLVEVS